MISPEILINKPNIQPLYPWYTPNNRTGGSKKRSERLGENIFPIPGFGASIGLYYPVFRTPELGWHSLLTHRTMKHIFFTAVFLEVISHVAWNAVRMPATNTSCMATLIPTFLVPIGQRREFQVFRLLPHHLVRTWADGHKPYPWHFMAVFQCTPATHI